MGVGFSELGLGLCVIVIRCGVVVVVAMCCGGGGHKRWEKWGARAVGTRWWQVGG